MSTSDSGSHPPPYGQPHYGQPPYGETQYGQPPYGRPQYGAPPPPPGYPYSRPTNSLAIVALVLSLTFAPAGLITGIIARRQIRRTQEDGDGLALAAVIVGGVLTAIFVLLFVVMIIAMVAVANDPYVY